jgi:hypothetical protein
LLRSSLSRSLFAPLPSPMRGLTSDVATPLEETAKT